MTEEQFARGNLEDQTNKSLVEFCIATQEIAKIKNEVAEICKQRRSNMNSCKDLIEKEFKSAGITCFETNINGKQEFIRMKENTTFGKVSEEEIFSCLKEASLNDLLIEASKSLCDNLLKYIESKIPSKTISTIFVSESAPRGFKGAETTIDVESKQKIVELANLMNQESLKLNEIRSSVKEKKQKFEQQKNQSETVVAEHLKHHDPIRQFRKIKLAQGGEEQTFFIRRQEKSIEGGLSFSKLSKIFKQVFIKLCDEHGIVDVPTKKEIKKIFDGQFLNKFESKLIEESCQLKKPKIRENVTLNKFAPKINTYNN